MSNIQVEELIIEGRIETVKLSKDSKGTHRFFEKLCIKDTSNNLVEYNKLLAIGNPADYLKEGFEGKIFAIKNVKGGTYLILGIETSDGMKVSDNERRKKAIESYKKLGIATQFKSAFGCAFLGVIVWLFVDLHRIAVGDLTAAHYVIGGFTLIGFFLPTIIISDAKSFATYEGIEDFLNRNGFNV